MAESLRGNCDGEVRVKYGEINVNFSVSRNSEKHRLVELLRDVHGVHIAAWKVKTMTLLQVQKVVELFKEQI